MRLSLTRPSMCSSSLLWLARYATIHNHCALINVFCMCLSIITILVLYMFNTSVCNFFQIIPTTKVLHGVHLVSTSMCPPPTPHQPLALTAAAVQGNTDTRKTQNTESVDTCTDAANLSWEVEENLPPIGAHTADCVNCKVHLCKIPSAHCSTKFNSSFYMHYFHDNWSISLSYLINYVSRLIFCLCFSVPERSASPVQGGGHG